MNHQHFINHCCSLAENGRGRTGTNPIVGAALVCPFDRDEGDAQVIAEGWHEGFGKPHAEAHLHEQINSTKIQKSDVLYVNLEPCCHHGKTPPCTDLILESGIKTVVFGMFDPDPQMAGKGIEVLKSGGCEVIGPINPVLCRRFNRGYVSLREKGRPWVTLKRAQTNTGQIAHEDGSPLKITSPEQDQWSHTHLRATHDAILVGVETVVRDDPLLTIRCTTCSSEVPKERSRDQSNVSFDSAQDDIAKSKKFVQYNPLRIVLDPECRVPLDAKIVSGKMAARTLLVVSEERGKRKEERELLDRGVEIIQCPVKGGHFDLDQLLHNLSDTERGSSAIASILVEGGAKTWEGFRKAGLVDEEVVLVNVPTMTDGEN